MDSNKVSFHLIFLNISYYSLFSRIMNLQNIINTVFTREIKFRRMKHTFVKFNQMKKIPIKNWVKCHIYLFIILFVLHRFCLPHTISLLLCVIYGTLRHVLIHSCLVRSFVRIDCGFIILFTKKNTIS